MQMYVFTSEIFYYTDWEILNRGPCFVNQFKRFVENSCENEILEPVCAIYDHQTKTFDNVCQLAIEIERSGNSKYHQMLLNKVQIHM